MPMSSFAALPDGRMHYLDWEGRQLPPLCFIHANGLNARTYRRMLTPLARRFHVLAPDLRGHGLSELPADPARHGSWDMYVRDLIRFLDSRGPAFLGGHSMGGVISLLTAAARPDLVHGLVVVEPVILPPPFYWLMRMRRKLGVRRYIYKIARDAARRRSIWPCARAVFRAYRGRGAFKTWPKEALEDYVAHGVRPRADGQVELTCAPAWEAENFSMHSPRLWRELPKVSCPAVVYHGTQGSTFVAAARGRFRRAVPHARIEEVEGASHFLPLERPEVVRAGIKALQGEIENPSGH